MEAGAVMEGDTVLLAEEWLAKNAAEGSFKSPSATEGSIRLLKDESPTLFCFGREVMGLRDDQNRLQEPSMMDEWAEVVGEGIEGN
jgi:hypothetical protein